MSTLSPRRCSGPSCTRPARALGLCMSHYRQRARGRPLAILRSGATEPKVMLTIRVPRAVREAARRDPEGARAALTTWTETRRKP